MSPTVYLQRPQPPLLRNNMGVGMETASLGQPVDVAAAAHFTLDSHHLAVLDRFIARARRHAGRHDHEFRGVVVHINPGRSVSVHGAHQESLVLNLGAVDGA